MLQKSPLEISFYKKLSDIYIETNIGDEQSFVVLKNKNNLKVTVPIRENKVTIIKKKNTSTNRMSYFVPVISDVNDIKVLSPDEYGYCKEMKLPLQLIPFIESKRCHITNYIRSKKYIDHNKYELITEL